MSGMQGCDVERQALDMALECRAAGMSAAKAAEAIADKLELEPRIVARIVVAAWYGDHP